MRLKEYKVILLKNKYLAKSKMLPEETKKVKEYCKRYGIYLNSLRIILVILKP